VPLPRQIYACVVLMGFGAVLIVLAITGVVGEAWVRWTGIGLVALAIAGEIYFLRRAARERP